MPEGWHRVSDIIFPGPEAEERREMERFGTKGTYVEDITDDEDVAEKKRGRGVPGAVVIVSAEAAAAEMISRSELASNVE